MNEITPTNLELNYIPEADTTVAQTNIVASGNGSVMKGGAMQSPNFIKGSSGWKLDAEGNFEGNNGNFRGDITGATGSFAGGLDVGGDDATSAHIDIDGNLWLGASIANKATAPFRVSNAGAATFKSIQVGGSSVQYSLNDYGLFSFGDGSDGALSTSGNVTLTSDKYYTNLTINNGHIFNPAGYRVFCNGTLTIKAGGILARNGNNGTSNTNDAAGKAGGAELADGYLKGSAAGGGGGAGGASSAAAGTAGTAGASTANSIGSVGHAGGAGGGGGVGRGAGGDAGAAGAATACLVKLIANWHLATLLDVGSTGATVKFDNSGAAGGGGGGGGKGTYGYGGGGGGSAGGIIAIYVKTIIIEATGLISANGGNGGNGGAEGGNDGGGGGGGGGGNGGQIICVYNSLTNAGSITVTAGTKGTGGNMDATGIDGSDGVDGVAGTIRYFNISL